MKIAATVLALLSSAGAAQAATCSIDAVQPIVFGAYDTLSSANVDGTGSISWSCTGLGPSEAVVIDIDGGGSGNAAARTLTSMGASLGYVLSLDAARLTPWGDGTGSTSHYGPVQASGATVTVYGRIPGGQNAPAGGYTDTVTVTLVF